jgi:hypothetical protein
MDTLTISQLQYVVGWSYPTALQFAKENGRQSDSGKWLVPYDAVAAEVSQRVIDSRKMEERLISATDNGNTP